MGISIVSYGKNSLDLRPTRVTTSPRERIEFVSEGSTVYTPIYFVFHFISVLSLDYFYQITNYTPYTNTIPY
jgi:hypothetical protein